MNLITTRLILEITPFISTILIESLTSGARAKFQYQLNNVSIDEVVDSSEREDIENAATHSFHFEQSMRYYDLATIATFIIFLLKALDPTANASNTATAGVFVIVSIIALRVNTRRYFESRPPNKYGNTDQIVSISKLDFELYKGELQVIVANLIPVVSIVILDYLSLQS